MCGVVNGGERERRESDKESQKERVNVWGVGGGGKEYRKGKKVSLGKRLSRKEV